jgi:radical SAM protein with 4Fe4S-binding SPASM domain
MLSNQNLFSDCDCGCSNESFQNYGLVFLELTPACNNRCQGCGNTFVSEHSRQIHKANYPLLTKKDWKTVISNLYPRVQRVNITGGEPTLYKDFFSILKHLDEYGLRYSVFTNARWRSPEKIILTFNELSCLGGLLVSLHGQTSILHESFTLISGSFSEAISNIKLAIKHGISIFLSCIITRYNYQYCREMYQFAQSLGVQSVVFNRYIGKIRDTCAPSFVQLHQAMADIELLREEGAAVKLSATIPQCFGENSTRACGAGKSFLTIDPWGNVKPCNHAPLILGNLTLQPLEEIIESTQSHYWENLLPETCTNCKDILICGGGCRAEAMLNQTNLDSLIQPFPDDVFINEILSYIK